MTGKDLGREIRNWAAAAAAVARVGRGLWDAIRSVAGRRKTKAVRAPLIRKSELYPAVVIETNGKMRDARATKE